MTTLLFDLYASGHHGPYLRLAARAWRDRLVGGRLLIAGATSCVRGPDGLESVPDLRDDPRVEFLALAEPAGWSTEVYGKATALKNDIVQGRVLADLVRRFRPDRVVLLYADHLQASLAFSLRNLGGTRLTGVHFRPTLHRVEGSGAAPDGPGDRSKRWLLRLALRNPHLDRWLTLDPYAVPSIRALAPDLDVRALPDGTDLSRGGQSRQPLLDRYGAESGGHVMLCFGEVNARKGVPNLLAALKLVERATQDALTVLLAGEIARAERGVMESLVSSARRESRVRIVLPDRPIPDADVQDLFHAADSVFVAYPRHTGSSGVLIRAAAAGVPVVGPSRGLMARHIEAWRLGIAVDPDDRGMLARSIDEVVAGLDPDDPRFDPERSRAFAGTHTPAAFAEALFPGEADAPDLPAHEGPAGA